MSEAQPSLSATTVSFDDEPLILVDDQDAVLGFERKDRCHRGDGLLHRAFSIFVFDGQGQVLLQQRAAGKWLWPGFWSNSCCSHPRRGETLETATGRRLREELGICTPLRRLYAFRYHARFGNRGSESELCHVLVGCSDEPPRPNPQEIAQWAYVRPEQLDAQLSTRPDDYTPWLKMEWARLRTEFGADLAALRPDRQR